METREKVGQAIKEFYNSVGVEMTTRRTSEQAKCRGAISTALRGKATQEVISSFLLKDRSSIAHYHSLHDQNMQFWEGYSSLWLIASEVVFNHFEAKETKMYLKEINNTIKELQERKEKIESKLNKNSYEEA